MIVAPAECTFPTTKRYIGWCIVPRGGRSHQPSVCLGAATAACGRPRQTAAVVHSCSVCRFGRVRLNGGERRLCPSHDPVDWALGSRPRLVLSATASTIHAVNRFSFWWLQVLTYIRAPAANVGYHAKNDTSAWHRFSVLFAQCTQRRRCSFYPEDVLHCHVQM